MGSSVRIFGAVGLFVCSSVAANASCLMERGRAQAGVLVDQCLQVSPATHPPCNASNACSLIEQEIARGCHMLDSDQPDFCDDY